MITYQVRIFVTKLQRKKVKLLMKKAKLETLEQLTDFIQSLPVDKQAEIRHWILGQFGTLRPWVKIVLSIGYIFIMSAVTIASLVIKFI